MGKGDIKIKTKNGVLEMISNVLFVPSLKSNLLSVGQLLEKGYVITLQDASCETYDPVRGTIAVVPMTSNRLFPLKIESTQPCLMAEIKNPSWLWHFRYGHLSFGGLTTLEKKNTVSGLPQIVTPSQVCENVLLANNIILNFKAGSLGEQETSWSW